MYLCPWFFLSSLLSCFMLMSLILWFSWHFICLCCPFLLVFLHFFAYVVGLSFCRCYCLCLFLESLHSDLSVFSNALAVFIPLFSVCRSFVVPCPAFAFLSFSLLISVFRFCLVTCFCRSLLLSSCGSFFLSFCLSFFLWFCLSVFRYVCLSFGSLSKNQKHTAKQTKIRRNNTRPASICLFRCHLLNLGCC